MQRILNRFFLITAFGVSALLNIFIFTQTTYAGDGVLFENLTMADGLPENSVTSIIQDHLGFLWFGTQNGLVKYDGYDFIVYKNDILDSTTLSNYNISSMLEDSKKNIWIGTNLGLNKFLREKNEFIRIYHDSNDINSISDNEIIAIYEDSRGTLWVGTVNGLNELTGVSGDGRNFRFNRFLNDRANPGSISNNVINDIEEDKEGNLWVGTENGLNMMEMHKKDFIHFTYEPGNRTTLSGSVVSSILRDKEGVMWVGTTNGLNKFDAAKKSFIRFMHDERNAMSIKDNRIKNLFQSSSGDIWVGAYSGMCKLNWNDALNNIGDFSLFLEGRFILCSFEERTGILWAGTWLEGLYKYDEKKEIFRYYRHEPGKQNSLLNDTVTSFYETRSGEFLIGTERGLDKMDPTGGVFIHSYSEINMKLKQPTIMTIVEDSLSNIWFGMFGKGYSNPNSQGLCKISNTGNVYSIYKTDEKNQRSISQDNVMVALIDKSGALWAGTIWGRGGLCRYDRVSDDFTRYFKEENNAEALSANWIDGLYEDSGGVLWVGTDGGGINKFDKNRNVFFSSFKNMWSNSTIFDFLEDRRGNLWAASFQEGLILLDRNCCAVRRYTQKNGLLDDCIWGIKEDGAGNLWLSTFKGLSVLDPNSSLIRNYKFGKEIHLTTSLRNVKAFYKSREGEFFLGGIDGFVRFFPDSIKYNSNPPPVIITSFKIFGNEAVLDSSISEKKGLKINYNDNFFSFEFAALDYSDPSKNKYAYKLEAVNKDWIYSDASGRTASYTNIDPGEYVFRVKGSNNDGVWNEEGTSIKIIITPPFWKTWWFNSLSVLFVFTVFGGSVRYVTVQRYRRRLALEKERSRISKDMHDEVGSSLTKIAILSQLTKQNISNPELAKTNVEKISESASEVVDNISEIIWAINPKNDTLDNLLAYIREYASETLEIKNIGYSIKLPDNIPPHHLSAEVRRNIFLVVKEALNNILKYAEATKVGINIISNNGQLEITISDNGKGFDINNTRKFGNGLINMKKRVEDIGGEIKIDSVDGKGTTIKIVVNLNKS